jgi:hypothetical protein
MDFLINLCVSISNETRGNTHDQIEICRCIEDISGEEILNSADSAACEISTHSLGSEISERSSQVRSNSPHCSKVMKRDCDCQCGLLAAELEGIKLDLVIMQRNVESKTNAVNNDEVTKPVA